jgi:hypothetical protein
MDGFAHSLVGAVLSQADNPLPTEEGWLRQYENVAKLPKRRRRGGRSQRKFPECIPATWLVSDHPVRSK